MTSETETKSKKKKKVKLKNALYNIEMPYKTRNNVINFFDDYSLIVFKARHEETKGTGTKY